MLVTLHLSDGPATLRRLLVLCALALAALPGAASAAPAHGAMGTAYVGLMVANVDPDDDAVIDITDENGQPVALRDAAACSAVASNPGAYVGVHVLPALATSDDGQPLAIVARSDWNTSGGAVATAGGVPAERLMVPVAVIDYYGQNTTVRIRNTTARTLSVTATLRADGVPLPLVLHNFSIPARNAATLDLATHLAFATVMPNTPSGFLGSLELTADGSMAAWATIDLTRQAMGVWGIEALRPEDASDTLFAPLVRHRWNGYDTGIAVVNPGSTPVTVDVTYTPSPVMGPAPVTTHGQRTIAGGGSTVFYQGPGGGHRLPARFVGSATISASGGKVLAIVNDAFELGVQSAAYTALPASAAGTHLLVPSVQSRLDNSLQMSTGIQVMNPGAAKASARLIVRDAMGVAMPCGAPCDATIAAGGTSTFVFRYAGLNALPENSYGSAELEADAPLIAVVNDFSGTGRIDATAYNAPPCRAGGTSLVGIP